jgi:hypothetical protein
MSGASGTPLTFVTRRQPAVAGREINMEDVPAEVQASARLRDLGHVVSVRTAQRIRGQALRQLSPEPPTAIR